MTQPLQLLAPPFCAIKHQVYQINIPTITSWWWWWWWWWCRRHQHKKKKIEARCLKEKTTCVVSTQLGFHSVNIRYIEMGKLRFTKKTPELEIGSIQQHIRIRHFKRPQRAWNNITKYFDIWNSCNHLNINERNPLVDPRKEPNSTTQVKSSNRGDSLDGNLFQISQVKIMRHEFKRQKVLSSQLCGWFNQKVLW
jgi:hypothetical protein